MDKQKKTLLILAVLLGVALLGLLGAKKLADKKEKAALQYGAWSVHKVDRVIL